MKYFSCLLAMVIISHFAIAQYAVNISYKNPKDSLLYFRVSTFDEKLFIPKDTIKIVKNKANISSSTPIIGGFYAIYLPTSGKKIMLCIENKDVISLKLNGDHLTDSLQCSDPKNKLFIEYQKLEEKFEYLDSQYLDMQRKGVASLKKKETLYKKKRETLLTYRNNAMGRLNSKGLLHKYFKTLNTIDEFTPDKNKHQERTMFINSFDLKDPQLYFSPVVKQILYEYLSAYPLTADSVLKGIDVVMSKLNCKDKVYPNTFNYISTVLQNNSIKNNVAGYTQFIEKYLINNKCNFLNKERQQEFLAKYDQLKQIASTDSAIDFSLKDTSGKTHTLSVLLKENNFTLISFYDPSCEHCQHQMPELDLVLRDVRKNTKLNILHVAVCNTGTMMETQWKTFINEHKMNEQYVHLILGDDQVIRNAYAAYSNPLFYLADQQGKLVLKKTSVSAIKNFLLSQTPKQ